LFLISLKNVLIKAIKLFKVNNSEKSFIFLLLFISLINKSYSKEVSSVSWSHGGDTTYNSCMMIVSFICTTEQDVESDVSNTSINKFIVIYNKKNELIKKFK